MSTSRQSFPFGLFVAAGLFLGSCDGTRSASSFHSERVPASYPEWCSAWKLSCPEGPAPNMPRPEAPWEVVQWEAAFRTLGGLASSPSQVRVTRSDMEDSRLDRISQALDLSESLGTARARVRDLGVESVRVEGSGAIRISFASEGLWISPRGLRVHHGAEATLRVDEGEALRFSGLGLSRDGDSEALPLNWARVSAPNVLDVGIGDSVVAGVPIAFVTEELVGELKLPPQDEPAHLERLAGLVGPTREWLVRSDRWIQLERPFLNALSHDILSLTKGSNPPDLGEMLSAILGSLDRVETKWHRTNGFLTAKVQPGKKLKCKMEGAPLVMEFKPEFGLNDLGGSAELGWFDVFGIKAKIDILGPLDPAFDIQRVELTPEKLIIKKVPIIGEYALDLADFNQPEGGKRLRCSAE